MLNDLVGVFSLWKREVLRFLKVFKQTIIPPIVSNLIFLFIFGFSLGSRIKEVEGASYISFIIPGLILMAIINNSYQNTSSSLYISRSRSHIEEVLVSPLSYFEMVLAYTLGGMTRGIIVGVSSLLIISLFVSVSISHVLLFIYLMVVVSAIFSSTGLIIGLWAEQWDHISVLTSFVITPLTFFGGVFHSVKMLPSVFEKISLLNPLFYMIDAFRYSMNDSSGGPLLAGILITSALAVVLFLVTVYLFKIGYKIRD